MPPSIGLISLSVDGAAVGRIERNGDQLTLGEAAATQRASDSAALRVYRRLHDGLPATLETRLRVQRHRQRARAAARARRLPQGFVATALVRRSAGTAGERRPPARAAAPRPLDRHPGCAQHRRAEQGRLEAAAGALAATGDLELCRRHRACAARAWRAQPIDAAQAGVPGDWAQLPAFALDDGAGLTIESGTRGNEGGRGDQLHLQRQLWLDFDGRGLTVADQLSGELRHHQRLDVIAPWQLQRAAQDGEPLLITQGRKGRQPASNCASARSISMPACACPSMPARCRAPAGSCRWKTSTPPCTCPYGYRLLGASGADRSPDSWVGAVDPARPVRGGLIALLAGRLLGWPWALLAAGYLALAQHESAAPLWTLAGDAGAGAAAAGAAGRALAHVRAGSLHWRCLRWPCCGRCRLPRQLQYALHPQLETASSSRFVSGNFAPPPTPPPAEEMAQMVSPQHHQRPPRLVLQWARLQACPHRTCRWCDADRASQRPGGQCGRTGIVVRATRHWVIAVRDGYAQRDPGRRRHAALGCRQQLSARLVRAGDERADHAPGDRAGVAGAFAACR